MEFVKEIWEFIQNQVLGMQWLRELIGNGLAVAGLDLSSRAGGSILFFLYDLIKIAILLCLLIFVISYIQSYFPPERSKKILGRFHGIGAKYGRCTFRNCHSVLLLLFDSAIYGIHKRRAASWCDIFFLDFFPDGRSGESCSSYEHLWRKGGCCICSAGNHCGGARRNNH